MESTDVGRSLEFAGLRIDYDARVLEPRPWTELQSRWAAELAETAPRGPLLELCSGAGHIGLGAAALSGRALVCVDVAAAAVELTTRNARSAGLGDRVEVRQAELQRALTGCEVFAVVLADPPWVRSDRIDDFAEDPPLAIDGGDDGLHLARACVTASLGHLPRGGPLLLQLGTAAQADEIAGWAGADGWYADGTRQGSGGVVLLLRHP